MPKPNDTADKTWRELGMKSGIRVPGTRAWMEEWRREPEQQEMIDYAAKVDLLVGTMSEENVRHHIKKYLSGQWGSEEEVIIAAAIRRTPTILEKYNQMEAQLMREKEVKEQKAVKKKAEGASLKARIESLEKEMGEIKAVEKELVKEGKLLAEVVKEVVGLVQAGLVAEGTEVMKREKKKRRKASKEERDHQPVETEVSSEVKSLLKDLEKAKADENKSLAAKIRAKLRKAGYSLRANSGK